MTTSIPKSTVKVPEPTLRRLPWYLSTVKLLKERGDVFASSTQISREIGIEASQITKDLSYLDISGRTRVGYEIETMINVLENTLGFTSLHRAYLFGVGSLGAALLQDTGLRQFGLEIVGAFDVRQDIVGTRVNNIPVYPIEELEQRMSENDIKIAILTVPISAAQSITDRLVSNDVKGIWNFTPVRILVPEHCVVENISLYASLAVMFNKITTPPLK